MRDIAFCTDAFATPQGRAYSEYTLALLLWALVMADESWLVSAPTFPLLYAAGVRWKREEPTGRSACPGGNGQEQFLGVRQVKAQGHADCEDVVAWRCAEVRLGRGADRKGPPPRPGHPEVTLCPSPYPGLRPRVDMVPGFFSRMVSPTVRLFHIVCVWPDGYVEDPSRQLGMGGFG